jgi:Tfp pilus assembly protein FimT
MAILSTVLAVAAPSLARFFRGRNLDSEAYRMVALSRYGQSRAAAEGIPMLLWLDEKTQRYGLRADPVWTRTDGREVQFELPEDVEFRIRQADLSRTNGSLEIRENTAATRPMIRFMPDGSFGPSSPEWIELHRRNDTAETDGKLWISPGWNRLYYEIWTNQPPNVRS